jgi:hypothetical protein
VKLDFEPVVPEVLQDNITRVFEDFIWASATHPVRFVETTDEEDADMVITVVMFKPVTSGQSAAGFFISTLGLLTPILMASAEAPFYIFFYYFPKSQSMADVCVHYDNAHHLTSHRLQGPGFLRSEENQLINHPRAYQEFFQRMQKHYNKDLKKQLRMVKSPSANL